MSVCVLLVALAFTPQEEYLDDGGDAATKVEGFPFEVEETSLVLGPAESPSAVLRLRLTRPVEGTPVVCLDVVQEVDAEPRPARVLDTRPQESGYIGGDTAPFVSVYPILVSPDFTYRMSADAATLDIPVPLPLGVERRLVTLALRDGEVWYERQVAYSRPDTDWVMHFVPGFHYDPVWWNTQAHYTETGRFMDAHVGPGLELVEQYLARCEDDPDYRVAMHQLPYLKTFLEARPEQGERLLEYVAEGRVGAVGGTYNELSTTLVSAEAVARNAAYGVLFQREVLGGSGETFWQCDVFGHDPSFPSLMARSGHTSGAFARGPFHQWGAPRDQVNFPSEFLWMSPDGESVLTHYMTGHYGYAYAKFANGSNRASDDPEITNALIAAMFEDLKRPALTHHVLFPMHMDFVRPLENLGEVVRAWNAKYVSPRAVLDTSADFFRAVREEIDAKGIVPTVITRDMNPIYTGCAVSFVDLKLANRECETTLREAEIWATVAAVQGADYPSLALDRAWRQLLFNAHHDGITGSMSDQVYVDVMAGYRDALELAEEVRERSLAYLESRIDTRGARGVVWNATAGPRRGWAETADGRKVSQGAPVPALGFAPLASVEDGSTTVDGVVLVNEHFRVELDLEKGGTIRSLVELRSGRGLLLGPANDLVVHEEYAVLPGHGEGPWHLAPTGKKRDGTGVTARLLPPDPDHPHRLVVEAEYPEFRKRQVIELLPGVARVDFETHILDWKGRNQLLRVEFPFDLEGRGRMKPIFQTAAAVIGRPFGRDVDTAKDPWTLDQTCWQWAGFGSLGPGVDGSVAEIIIDADASRELLSQANRLAGVLVGLGATTTITHDVGRRYGTLEYDSNLPDFRVVLARDEREILHSLGHDHSEIDWVGNVGRVHDSLPTLVVRPGSGSLGYYLEEILQGDNPWTLHPASRFAPTFALVNRGPISVHTTEDGRFGLNLLRSCTSWPSGTWMDPPTRRLPDGAPFGTMHGSHVFRYSLVAGEGDYRDLGLNARAQEVQHPLVARDVEAHEGDLPPSASFLEVSPTGVTVAALKPAGFPEARWRLPDAPERPTRVALRLWNGTGRATEARVELGTLAFDATRAWRSNLLEEEGEALALEDGVLLFAMEPHAYETVLLEGTPAPRDPDAPSLDPTEGDVAPSAYWLENRGEGVTANGVLALVPDAREVVHADGRVTIELLVVNNDRAREVEVDLTALAPEEMDVVIDPPTLAVAAASFGRATLEVSSAPTGRSLLTLTADGHGVVRPVTASVWISGPDADSEAPVIEIANATAIVSEGDALSAVVRNLTDGPIPATARWLLPMSMWDAVPDWTHEVVVPAQGELELTAPLGFALDNWAMLEVLFGGTVVYGETIAITSDPRKSILTFDVDRVRLRHGETSRVQVRATSLTGIEPDTPLELEVPDGFAVREATRRFDAADGLRTLAVDFDVEPDEASTRGSLRATGPNGSAVAAAYTVAPVQTARRAFADIRVDGLIVDWDDAEFTRAEGELGSVRCAVRYGSSGLALCFVVEDETLSQTHTDGTIWEGDSVQFALTTAPSADFGYGGRDLEFGAAHTPDGPLVWCWYGGEAGRTGRLDEAKVDVSRAGGRTFYELVIPRSLLPRMPLEPGAVLGFSYIANDDDGEGYRGATQWTGGMVGGKDSSLFGELVLTKE